MCAFALALAPHVDIQSLYREVVVAHHRDPRNFGNLPGHTHAADGHQPLCGDHLHMEAIVAEGRLQAVRFSGEACAIAYASASLLSDWVRGCDGAQLERLRDSYSELLRDRLPEGHALLHTPLHAWRALHAHPARHGCALLPLVTLQRLLAGPPAAAAAGNP